MPRALVYDLVKISLRSKRMSADHDPSLQQEDPHGPQCTRCGSRLDRGVFRVWNPTSDNSITGDRRKLKLARAWCMQQMDRLLGNATKAKDDAPATTLDAPAALDHAKQFIELPVYAALFLVLGGVSMDATVDTVASNPVHLAIAKLFRSVLCHETTPVSRVIPPVHHELVRISLDFARAGEYLDGCDASGVFIALLSLL
jgi:hypothetical protein